MSIIIFKLIISSQRNYLHQMHYVRSSETPLMELEVVRGERRERKYVVTEFCII